MFVNPEFWRSSRHHQPVGFRFSSLHSIGMKSAGPMVPENGGNLGSTVNEFLRAEKPSSWTCWKCGTQNYCSSNEQVSTKPKACIDLVFCKRCFALCDPNRYQIDLNSPHDVFKFFCLHPITFRIPDDKLRIIYGKFQDRLHPDRFVAADKKEQLYSEYWSTVASHCYAELKHPLKRARLMLKHLADLEGQNINEDERTTVSDPQLLDHIFKLNEKVDTLRCSEQAQHLYEEILQRYKDELSKLETAFLNQDRMKAQVIYDRCQMLYRVMERAHYWSL